jgi:hypothetical protein
MMREQFLAAMTAAVGGAAEAPAAGSKAKK